MQEKLARIKEEALAKLNTAGTMDTLNEIRLAYLGKKGELTEVLKGMRDVAPEERPTVGKLINESIRRSRGRDNKSLARFADQLRALLEKWEA